MAEYTAGYCCKWCDHPYAASKQLRKHVVKHHTDVTPEQLERHIVLTRLPDLDLDYIIQRYQDRLETIVTLQNDRGLFIKKYLKTIGVLRNWRADVYIGRFLTPDMKTPEDITRAMANSLVGKFLEASPEVRFQGYLNRDISVLKKAGVSDDLIPIVKTLKLIKFAKKQMSQAIKDTSPLDETAPPEPTEQPVGQ